MNCFVIFSLLPLFSSPVVFQRPPSGRQARTNTPINNGVKNSNGPVNNGLINNNNNNIPNGKTTHLLFEPSPPTQTKRFHARNSSYRRIQSAHGRIGEPSGPPHQNKVHTSSTKTRGVQKRTRPRSAVVPGENTGLDSARSCLASTPIPKHFLKLELSEGDGAHESRTPRQHMDGVTGQVKTERSGVRRSPASKDAGHSGRSIPKGIAQLTPWLTEDVPIEL